MRTPNGVLSEARDTPPSRLNVPGTCGVEVYTTHAIGVGAACQALAQDRPQTLCRGTANERTRDHATVLEAHREWHAVPKGSLFSHSSTADGECIAHPGSMVDDTVNVLHVAATPGPRTVERDLL